MRLFQAAACGTAVRILDFDDLLYTFVAVVLREKYALPALNVSRHIHVCVA